MSSLARAQKRRRCVKKALDRLDTEFEASNEVYNVDDEFVACNPGEDGADVAGGELDFDAFHGEIPLANIDVNYSPESPTHSSDIGDLADDLYWEDTPEFETFSDAEADFDFSFDDFDVSDVAQHVPDSDEVFQRNLASWAVGRIPQSYVTQLLGILKSHSCLNFLPGDCRTLLKTPRNLFVTEVHPGHYVHFGLIDTLVTALLNFKTKSPQIPIDLIDLSISIDGVSVSNSAPSQLWPISFRISNVKGLSRHVMNAGLFHGEKKPATCNSFLRPLIDELQVLLNEGALVGGSRVHIKHCIFVCDSPARAYIKGNKYHSGNSSCPYCTDVGHVAFLPRELRLQVRPSGRIVFLSVNSPLRTDQSFREQLDPEHHNSVSSLEELPIDMVRDFPLEPMHLVFLGAVRKLFIFLLKEPDFKLSPAACRSLNNLMVYLSQFTPTNFSRKGRSFEFLLQFKATEWYRLLMIIGPVILYPKLSREKFEHFMDLHVAVRILCSPDLYLEYNDYARQLLVRFVLNARIFYGEAFISHNIHCLIHLADDAKRLGPLLSFSAFPFENHIGKLTKLIRKSEKPLQQIAKRLVEIEKTRLDTETSLSSTEFSFEGEHNKGPLIPNLFDNGKQFSKARKGLFLVLKCDIPDNCVMLDDSSIFLIKNFTVIEKKAFIIGHHYDTISNLYTTPLESSKLNIFKVSNLAHQLEIRPIEDVYCKMFRFPIPWSNPQSFAVFPISVEEENLTL